MRRFTGGRSSFASPIGESDPSDPPPGWRRETVASLARGGVRFKVWAPQAGAVEVECGGRRWPMEPHADGVWTAYVSGVGAGSRYSHRLNGGSFPDPYGRALPHGV